MMGVRLRAGPVGRRWSVGVSCYKLFLFISMFSADQTILHRKSRIYLTGDVPPQVITLMLIPHLHDLRPSRTRLLDKRDVGSVRWRGWINPYSSDREEMTGGCFVFPSMCSSLSTTWSSSAPDQRNKDGAIMISSWWRERESLSRLCVRSVSRWRWAAQSCESLDDCDYRSNEFGWHCDTINLPTSIHDIYGLSKLSRSGKSAKASSRLSSIIDWAWSLAFRVNSWHSAPGWSLLLLLLGSRCNRSALRKLSQDLSRLSLIAHWAWSLGVSVIFWNAQRSYAGRRLVLVSCPELFLFIRMNVCEPTTHGTSICLG